VTTTSSARAAGSPAASDDHPVVDEPIADEPISDEPIADEPIADEHGADDGIQPAIRGGLALWALFLGYAMLMVGNGLIGAVLGVRTVDEGFGLGTSGVIMASFFAGFLLGPVVVMPLLSSVGHIRVFSSLAVTASSAVLVHLVWVSPISWSLMRFVFGFCIAGLYLVVESWLNDASTPRTRGRTLAVYGIATMGGLAAGQLLVATADPTGAVLFVAAAILVSLSFVPMALAATTDAPQVRVVERLGLRELVATVPTGAFGMLLVGVSHGVVLGLAAVYASGAGFSASRTALFVAAPAIGGLVMQWPVGWLSDRFARRGVIFGVASAATGVAALLALSPADSAAFLPLMMLLGGLTFPLYALLLSHTLDWSRPGTAIGASSTLLRINGAGAVVGPIVAGAAMAAFDASAMFWILIATHGGITVFVAYRLVVVDGLPRERQGAFVPVPARASELAIRLTSRPLRASREKPGPPTSSHRDQSGSDPTGFISGRRW